MPDGTVTLPPVTALTYNREKRGYFGELGNGAHARIRFLQSAVTKDELDNITLIENIAGSERWDIRDLFQRDVNQARVEESILPYLTDPTKVKFFNPLTLVLLPINRADGTVDAEVPYVTPVSISKDEHKYIRYEREGLFSFEVHEQVPAYSQIHWNDSRVKLVTIDGQHRLSALKFWKDTPGPNDLDAWQIPVVILGVFRADNVADHKPASLLEIVRKTFVFINTRAEEVNEARRILLDDEEIQAVCTQEVVQASHRNDCLPDEKRDNASLPLLFFDWRGQTGWRKDDGESISVTAPGSVLSIEEIYVWLREYILGKKPEIALQLNDLAPPLSENYRDRGTLTHGDTEQVRKRFLAIIYPGLSLLIHQFDPFRAYIQQIREFERSKIVASPQNARYAFQKLRFGSHPVLMGQQKESVDTHYKSIVGQLTTIRKDCFDELVELDIGKRAIVHAFAELKSFRDSLTGETGSWKKHAEWYVPKLNAVYQAGWFKSHNDLKREQRTLLTHICFDKGGSIINYKIGDVSKGLGPLLALLVLHEGLGEFSPEDQTRQWERFSEPLENTLRKGFRKEHRTQLRDSFPGTQTAFTAEVNKRADKSVVDRLTLIEKTATTAGA